MLVALLLLIGGLVLLTIGADRFVVGAVRLSQILGVTPILIGALVIGLGTSLPELLVSVLASSRGQLDIAIGNIVGSNIFNLLAVIGVAATIAPSPMAPSVLSLHIFVMVAFTLVLFAMTYDYDGKSELSRIEGAALLAAFIAYDTYVVLQTVRMAE